MTFGSFFKRFGSFLVALVAGLLIASIFVPVVAPRFEFSRRGGHGRRQHLYEDQMIRQENESLRRENMELKNRIRGLEGHDFMTAPEMEFERPLPPLAPRPFESK